jgi:hypothetical protein
MNTAGTVIVPLVIVPISIRESFIVVPTDGVVNVVSVVAGLLNAVPSDAIFHPAGSVKLNRLSEYDPGPAGNIGVGAPVAVHVKIDQLLGVLCTRMSKLLLIARADPTGNCVAEIGCGIPDPSA